MSGDVFSEQESDQTHLLQSNGRIANARHHSFPSLDRRHDSGSEGGYEEVMKDSVACPSCRGIGRVPKGMEGQLIALIPMKDKRLKPRRTYLSVGAAILLCLLTAGLCIFFLFPRDITVTSNRPMLEPLKMILNISAYFVNLTVVNNYNFTNNNFFPVRIQGAQMTAMYDDRMMAAAVNSTAVDIPIKSKLTYSIYMNIVLSRLNQWGFLVAFCEDQRPWVHNLPITFELTANYTYLGHLEQATLVTFQQVSCYNGSAY